MESIYSVCIYAHYNGRRASLLYIYDSPTYASPEPIQRKMYMQNIPADFREE